MCHLIFDPAPDLNAYAQVPAPSVLMSAACPPLAIPADHVSPAFVLVFPALVLLERRDPRASKSRVGGATSAKGAAGWFYSLL